MDIIRTVYYIHSPWRAKKNFCCFICVSYGPYTLLQNDRFFTFIKLLTDWSEIWHILHVCGGGWRRDKCKWIIFTNGMLKVSFTALIVDTICWKTWRWRASILFKTLVTFDKKRFFSTRGSGRNRRGTNQPSFTWKTANKVKVDTIQVSITVVKVKVERY